MSPLFMGSELVSLQNSANHGLLEFIGLLWNNSKINYKNISGEQALDTLVLVAQKLEEQLTLQKVSGYRHIHPFREEIDVMLHSILVQNKFIPNRLYQFNTWHEKYTEGLRPYFWGDDLNCVQKKKDLFPRDFEYSTQKFHELSPETEIYVGQIYLGFNTYSLEFSASKRLKLESEIKTLFNAGKTSIILEDSHLRNVHLVVYKGRVFIDNPVLGRDINRGSSAYGWGLQVMFGVFAFDMNDKTPLGYSILREKPIKLQEINKLLEQ